MIVIIWNLLQFKFLFANIVNDMLEIHPHVHHVWCVFSIIIRVQLQIFSYWKEIVLQNDFGKKNSYNKWIGKDDHNFNVLCVVKYLVIQGHLNIVFIIDSEN